LLEGQFIMADDKKRFLLRLKAANRVDFPPDGMILDLGLHAKIRLRSHIGWLLVESRGYASEADAQESSRKLGDALLLAGAERNIGFDLGLNRRMGGMGASVKNALFEAGVRVRDAVHGVDIFDDMETSIPSLEAYMTFVT
jgi:hypothetical protein